MRLKKLNLLLGYLLLTVIMVFGYSRHLNAGTYKALTWCSYLDIDNDSIGNIDRMRCLFKAGAATDIYCFKNIVWQNNTFTKHPCDNWLRGNLSDEDLEKIHNEFGDLNIEKLGTFSLPVLKNERTGDIAIIHLNKTSNELQKCETLEGSNTAGEVGEYPADICWLGDKVRDIPKEYIEP